MHAGGDTAEDGRVGSWRGGPAVGEAGLMSPGVPRAPTSAVVARSFFSYPIEPSLRFCRTRLTDVLHRSVRPEPARAGWAWATTMPLRDTSRVTPGTGTPARTPIDR